MKKYRLHASCAPHRDPHEYANKQIEETLSMLKERENNKIIKTEAISPGTKVKQCMDDRNMSVKDLIRIINNGVGLIANKVKPDEIKALLDDKIEVDQRIARRLENTFGIHREEWLTLNYYYRKELLLMMMRRWEEKIDNELESFEQEMLKLSKKDLYDSAYKIFTIDNICCLLKTITDKDHVERLSKIDNISEFIYCEYLKTDTSEVEDFNYIIGEIMTELGGTYEIQT